MTNKTALRIANNITEFKNLRAKYLFKYLKDMIIENEWDNNYTKEWARSFVTTICIIDNIDVDTAQWDNMIREIYNDCVIYNVYGWDDYDRFDMYMAEYLV